jgi:hypothetical protein
METFPDAPVLKAMLTYKTGYAPSQTSWHA